MINSANLSLILKAHTWCTTELRTSHLMYKNINLGIIAKLKEYTAASN